MLFRSTNKKNYDSWENTNALYNLYKITVKTDKEKKAVSFYASIYCSIDGSVKEYTVEIEKINLSHRDINKSMVIRVKDQDLLEKTGGIVQGMSGSPILQDGKLIGAVTHVFVADPSRGYAIFAENMLEK